MKAVNQPNIGQTARSVCLATMLLLTLTLCAATKAATIIVDDLGDSGPGNCSATCTLRDAIATAAQGDVIDFAPTSPQPWMITLNGTELFVYKSVTIAGPGPDQLSIDANGQSRLVEVALGATVAITGIHLTNGFVQGSAGTPAGGSAATAGAPAFGGAFLVNPGTSLLLDATVIDQNHAVGGAGGASGFSSSQGAAGGDASGGAIYNAGFLSISRTSLVNNAVTGGAGGLNQVFPGQTGAGGNGGDAFGGAIAGPGQSELVNVVVSNNSSEGGIGGAVLLLYPDQIPGNGGNAVAGGINAGGVVVLQFVTMTQNTVIAGLAGPGAGVNGQSGSAAASDIYAGSTVLLRSSIVASGGGSCVEGVGSFALQGVNFNSDSTCPGFTVASNLVKPLTEGMNGYSIAFPVYKSPLIDAAIDCDDAFGNLITIDVEGVARPQGNACDVGAVESDYIFVDGFGG